MTYNDRQCSHPFSQGQIAVVVALPRTAESIRDVRLRLQLAPPGTRHIRDTSDLPHDWPEVVIKARTTPAVIVGPGLQMGRRTQLPIRFYICSTIHRIQGDTLPLVATQITDSSKEYRLWQKEQLAVLISRVSQCKDIIFVGNRQETRLAVERILACSSKWDSILDYHLSVLDVAQQRNLSTVREIRQEIHPFLPIYQELPAADCGFVYLLVSMSCPLVFHVGHCDNIKKQLRNINTGYGEIETRDTNLHPWGVFALVTGFEIANVQQLGINNRLEFAQQLKNSTLLGNSVEEAYNQAKLLAGQWAMKGHNYTIIKCGQLLQ